MDWPTEYTHGSKKHLGGVPHPGRTALVIWKSNQDEIADYDLYRYMAYFKDVLIIFSDDIDVSYDLRPSRITNADLEWLYDNQDMPNANQVTRMATFLQKHKDDPIHFACDAGASRSGFGHFFLDMMNDNLEGVYADFEVSEKAYINGEEYYGKLHIWSQDKHYIPNAEYVRLAIELGYLDGYKINSLPSREDS